MLIGFRGGNTELVVYALQHTPCLLVDCANAANPHKVFPLVPDADFTQVYVIGIELIYAFRDVLRLVEGYADSLRVTGIVITSFEHLFHYQDELENKNVLAHAWELMEGVAKRYQVVVGIGKGHEYFLKKCDAVWDTRFGVNE